MESFDKIAAFTNTVCEQIRWKKAHSPIEEELKNHILDQRDFYMKQGLTEDEATIKAIEETGDPVMLGAQFDRTHRPKPQWTMLGGTLVLLLISFTVRLFFFNEENASDMLIKWLFYTVLGTALLFTAYFSDFTLIGRFPKTVYFSVMVLSAVVLYFSPTLNGRSYYTTYLTLLFPLAFAAIVFSMGKKGYKGLIVCQAAFILPAFIAALIPSMSGLLLYSIASLTLLVIALLKNWFHIRRLYGFLMLFAPLLPLFFVFALNMNPYQLQRLLIVINPSLDLEGSGYWAIITRELLAGAGWLGDGSGANLSSFGLTPNSMFLQSDLLLTVLIALSGWISFAVILSVFLFFMIKGIRLCLKQKSGLGLLVSLSVMMTFALQVISYVIYNLGFQFTSPLSLPLLSQGNTAMLLNMFLIGILLSVFRTGSVVSDKAIANTSHGYRLPGRGNRTVSYKG